MNQFSKVNLDEDIKLLEPPLLREILEQNRLILEMNKELLVILSHPLTYISSGKERG